MAVWVFRLVRSSFPKNHKKYIFGFQMLSFGLNVSERHKTELPRTKPMLPSHFGVQLLSKKPIVLCP